MMATFVNAKVVGTVYPTDFTITRPISSTWILPGHAIITEGVIESASHVTQIRSQYNGSWLTADLGSSLNVVTGEYSFSLFGAVLGVETLDVEVTWDDGTVLQKTTNFVVIAA